VHSVMLEAFRQYKEDCEQRTFPDESRSFPIDENVMKEIKLWVELLF